MGKQKALPPEEGEARRLIRTTLRHLAAPFRSKDRRLHREGRSSGSAVILLTVAAQRRSLTGLPPSLHAVFDCAGILVQRPLQCQTAGDALVGSMRVWYIRCAGE